jgi:hypothetical protein
MAGRRRGADGAGRAPAFDSRVSSSVSSSSVPVRASVSAFTSSARDVTSAPIRFTSRVSAAISPAAERTSRATRISP